MDYGSLLKNTTQNPNRKTPAQAADSFEGSATAPPEVLKILATPSILNLLW
jgi:hypothetical protein